MSTTVPLPARMTFSAGTPVFSAIRPLAIRWRVSPCTGITNSGSTML